MFSLYSIVKDAKLGYLRIKGELIHPKWVIFLKFEMTTIFGIGQRKVCLKQSRP